MFTLLCLLPAHPSGALAALGPMTVWVAPDSWEDKYEDESQWTKVCERTLEPSRRAFAPLEFSEPVIIPRGSSVGMYVHSRRRNDTAIVYDNQRSRYTHTDRSMALCYAVVCRCGAPAWGPNPLN